MITHRLLLLGATLSTLSASFPFQDQSQIEKQRQTYREPISAGRPNTFVSTIKSRPGNMIIPSRSSERLPRLIVYQQTHHQNEQPIRLDKLAYSGLTHIYIAAFHLNGGMNVTLNDHPPDHPRFDLMWQDVEVLKKSGIKVMGMVGGATPGSFTRLDSNATFAETYAALKRTIERHKLEGIDLDVEERMSIDGVRRLIRWLKRDFGKDFIVTLAPVYPAMLASHRRVSHLARRVLHPEAYTVPDPITASLCKCRNLSNKRNLSGFSYIELAQTKEGKMIDWYNVQMYCGWGDPARPGSYEAIIETGWEPSKIVMGVVTNPGNGAGYRNANELEPVLQGLVKKYQDFGGLMGWELFNAVTMPNVSIQQQGPPWVQAMATHMGVFDAKAYSKYHNVSISRFD
jgi:hypothetical protein